MVSEVTERAMRGELDFTASLRQRGDAERRDASICCRFMTRCRKMPGLAQHGVKLETLAGSGDRLRQVTSPLPSCLRDNCISTRYLPMSWRSAMQALPATRPAISSMRNKAVAQAWKSMGSQRRKPGCCDGANDPLSMIKAAGALGIARFEAQVNEQAEVIRH